MAKQTFNEAEMYLLNNWTAACRLEEALNTIRHERYAAIVEETGRMIVDKLGKADFEYQVFPTQNWGNGFISFWMKRWDGGIADKQVPSFVVGGLKLELLLTDDDASDDMPSACLYTKDLRKDGWDLEKLTHKIHSAAADILADFPARGGEEDTAPICYYLPEGRTGLKRLLFEDEAAFIKTLVEHGIRIAELAPAVTKVLSENSKKDVM